jgi:hypothetical protein
MSKFVAKLALAAAALAAMGAAQAENLSVPVSLDAGPDAGMFTASFGVTHHVGGAFTDTFTFSPSVGPSFVDGSLVTIGFNWKQNIDFTSADLNGNPLSLSPNGAIEGGGLFPVSASGILVLTVHGIAGNGRDVPVGASYSGTLNVNPMPVPEPETYALMLGGLGAIAFVARRRKNVA